MGLVDAKGREEGGAVFTEGRGIVATGAGEVDFEVQRDAALVEDEGAVGKGQGFIDIMGDEEDGGEMGLPEGGDHGLHFEARQGVQGGEGFVEHQELGFADQGAGEGNALGFAAGESQGPGVQAVAEADFRQGGFGVGAGIRHAQAEDDVAPDALPGEQARFLEDDGAGGGDGDGAGGGFVQP